MILKQAILFSEIECNLIIELQKNNKQTWLYKDREYQSESITFNENNEWLFKKLKNFFEDETGHKINRLNNTIHFHKYKNGDFFEKHNDNRGDRLYGVGVLLNNNFDGGDFIFYNKEKILINKIAGNAYIFDVNIDHKVEAIKSDYRYSILWFLGKDNIKKPLTKIL